MKPLVAMWFLAFGQPGAWEAVKGHKIYSDPEKCFDVVREKNKFNYEYPTFTCVRKAV